MLETCDSFLRLFNHNLDRQPRLPTNQFAAPCRLRKTQMDACGLPRRGADDAIFGNRAIRVKCVYPRFNIPKKTYGNQE